MNYDYAIFASYGNDSIALIQWMFEKYGKSKRIAVVYTSTGWAAEYWAERVKRGEEWVRSLGFDAFTIESEGMENLVRRKKAWPRAGGKYQFCTENLKQKPALAWLDSVDAGKEIICCVGVRREESENRADFPEWTDESEKHGGRELYAPLVRHTEKMRNALIKKTPFDFLPTRSKECWPCTWANHQELRVLDEPARIKVLNLETEMGVNSKGNPRVLFRPVRFKGAVGINAVLDYVRRTGDDMFNNKGCDGGWCGA
jgi:3'-phosphoadenosine 5'-phosphosulfate sulfotransferase (PAPS reductase)/FAD synthetase